MMRTIAVMIIAMTAAACSARQNLRAGPRVQWMPLSRTSAPVHDAQLDDRAGLCPLDVPGLTTEMRSTRDRVLLLVKAPPGSARDELGERARIMTYATHYLLPSAHADRIGRLPIAVDVSVQSANGSLILTFKPQEPWKLDELAELLASERRWLGGDRCRSRSLETVKVNDVPLAAP